MRSLLAEYPAWFDPDEAQILLAAFDKAWEAVQASGVTYFESIVRTDSILSAG
jgi:hypothetical protein